MKLQASCLLLLCSLTAFCEDAKVVAESNADPALPEKPGLELAGKLEWNVEPAHWEKLVGNGVFAATSDATAESLVSRGPLTSQFDLSSGAGAVSDGTMKEADVDRVLRKLEKQEGLRLGRSDYVVRTPILEGLIPRRAPDDASLGEKILNLPIVRWFRPLPLPEPPGGGKYFKWGERAESWRDYSQPALGPGAMDNGLYRGGG